MIQRAPNRSYYTVKGACFMGNQIRTTILLAVMTALIIWVGQLLGGRQGMIIALIFAAGMNFFSYWYSDKLVLKMYRASEVAPGQAPELYDRVQRLTQQAGLPMPKLYVIPQQTPNAFATGRNPEHAVVEAGFADGFTGELSRHFWHPMDANGAMKAPILFGLGLILVITGLLELVLLLLKFRI